MVEAASIALALYLTRAWLWDRLSAATRGHLRDWLGGFVGRQTPRSNWVLFRTIVEEFLAGVGGPHRHAEIVDGLDAIAGWQLDDGWYTDGAGRRVDHYNGWALHLYPLFWTQLAASGPRAALAAELSERYRARLSAFLADYIHLVGGDGAPLHQGRSLTYRMAAAAPLWAGALFDATPLEPGLARRAASGILRYLTDRGVPDERGLLTLGWLHPFRGVIQPYSGPASPYWAAKGFLGLLLPPTHPVWTEIERPLPVERCDSLRALRGPNWLVQGTRADGIVRIHNHGSDRVSAGATTDDAHYARLSFSTASAPRTDSGSFVTDATITVIDPQGAEVGRGRIQPLGVNVTDGIGHAASWHAPTQDVRIESHVLAFGRFEVNVHAIRAPRGWTVREAGHNLSGIKAAVIRRGAQWIVAEDELGRCTAIAPLLGYQMADVEIVEHADAFGKVSAVPYLVARHSGGDAFYAACVSLSGEPVDTEQVPPVAASLSPGRLTIQFPHGVVRSWRLESESRSAPALVPLCDAQLTAVSAIPSG